MKSPIVLVVCLVLALGAIAGAVYYTLQPSTTVGPTPSVTGTFSTFSPSPTATQSPTPSPTPSPTIVIDQSVNWSLKAGWSIDHDGYLTTDGSSGTQGINAPQDFSKYRKGYSITVQIQLLDLQNCNSTGVVFRQTGSRSNASGVYCKGADGTEVDLWDWDFGQPNPFHTDKFLSVKPDLQWHQLTLIVKNGSVTAIWDNTQVRFGSSGTYSDSSLSDGGPAGLWSDGTPCRFRRWSVSSL